MMTYPRIVSQIRLNMANAVGDQPLHSFNDGMTYELAKILDDKIYFAIQDYPVYRGQAIREFIATGEFDFR